MRPPTFAQGHTFSQTCPQPLYHTSTTEFKPQFLASVTWSAHLLSANQYALLANQYALSANQYALSANQYTHHLFPSYDCQSLLNRSSHHLSANWYLPATPQFQSSANKSTRANLQLQPGKLKRDALKTNTPQPRRPL
ncbi:hypothetical protein PtB15_8B811 [Puccinia triticina]|nr:hypothetical protein PtB15_8B811 [Puccinia triticina]